MKRGVGSEFWSKVRNQATVARFWSRRVRQQRGTLHSDGMVVMVGSRVRETGGGERVLVHSPKWSRCGSVLVTPRENATGDIA